MSRVSDVKASASTLRLILLLNNFLANRGDVGAELNYRSGRGYKQSRCLNRATKSQSTHVTFLTVFVFCLFFVTVDATAAHVFTSGRLFCIFFLMKNTTLVCYTIFLTDQCIVHI